MKKGLLGLFFFLCLSCIALPTFAQEWFVDPDPVSTRDLDKVVGNEITTHEGDLDNPLRRGAWNISEGLNGIFNTEKLEDTATARDRTTRYIKGILNYILSIIGLVALVYLIFQGFRVLTAATNDEERKNGLKGMRYAAFAILGVGLSWFILSLLFWILQLVTN